MIAARITLTALDHMHARPVFRRGTFGNWCLRFLGLIERALERLEGIACHQVPYVGSALSFSDIFVYGI